MMYEKKVSSAMRERKHMDFDWALKTLDDSGVFAGYASVFSVIDQQQDMMIPGAFHDTLLKQSGKIKLLWQHDMKEPIGMIEQLMEDENGLYIKGRLLLDVARAQEAYSLLRNGVLSGLSIGYSPLRYEIDPATGVRLLKEVELWEVSLVTFPANSAARVTVVKQDEVTEWKAAERAGLVVTLSDALDKAMAVLK